MREQWSEENDMARNISFGEWKEMNSLEMFRGGGVGSEWCERDFSGYGKAGGLNDTEWTNGVFTTNLNEVYLNKEWSGSFTANVLKGILSDFNGRECSSSTWSEGGFTAGQWGESPLNLTSSTAGADTTEQLARTIEGRSAMQSGLGLFEIALCW